MNAKRTTRPQNLTIYMGAGEQRDRRIRDLEKLATELAGTTDEGKPAVSKMFQLIADGKLRVAKNEE